MAMQFNLPPAGTTLTPAEALNNLRQGYMVDRFTGAAIDRTLAGQNDDVSATIGATNAVNMSLSSTRSVTAAGSYHISDRVILMTAGNLIAANPGVHISFYNCTFIVDEYRAPSASDRDLVFAFGITNDALDLGSGGREASARVDEGAAATRSINFYGCTVTVSTTGVRNNMRCQIADSIGSDFRFGGDAISNGDLILTPSPQRGGRWINTRFVAGQQRNMAASMQTYGFPDIYENVELYGFGFDNGVGSLSAGPRMLVEPTYTLLGQQNIYTTQTGANSPFTDQAQILQNVGFFTPPDNLNNADNDVITFQGLQAGSAGYVDIQNGGGGCINYAAYQPTYIDAVTGTGIQNVKVRVNTSVTVLNPEDASVANTFHNKLTRPGTPQDISGNFIGNEYLTNTNGLLTTSMQTQDGWSTSTPGFYNPMQFDFHLPTGSNILAENTLTTVPLSPPLNTALAVIQDIRGTGAADLTFTTHTAQYQAFSWTHEILQELEENSTRLTDGTARAVSTDYGINRDVSVTAPSLVGTVIKPGITTNANTPDLVAIQGFFDQDDVPSINDIRMAWRYERWEYNVFGDPQTTELNIVVDNTISVPWTAPAGGNTIDVRGAGLTAKSDDVFTTDANILTLDMNGNPISNLTLGSRSVSGPTGVTLFEELRQSATLPAATNSTLIGRYIIHGTSGDSTNITFDGCDVSGLDISVPVGVVVNIRGTDNDGNLLTASSFMSVGGSGTANFPPPVVQRTIETPDVAGYFGVRNVTQNSTTAAIVTGGGTIGTFSIPSGNTDTFRFYWKARNDANTGYATTIIERSNVGLTASTTETMEATPYIATLYSGDSSIGRANTDAPVLSSTAAGNNGMRVLVNSESLSGIDSPGAASQFHILTGMDSTRYIDVLTANNLMADVINPDSLSSSVSDARYIQVDTQTTNEQQQLQGTNFSNVEENLPEALRSTNFTFVTNMPQVAGTDRFYILDSAGNFIQDNDRWPGTIGSTVGADITGVRIVFEDADGSSLIAQDLQTLVDRGLDFTRLFGDISVRSPDNIRRATYSFTGVEIVSGVYTFNLTGLTSADTSGTLDDQGIDSGATGTSLSGNTRTGTQTDQVVQITQNITGGGTVSFPSVILFPNPAGATPAQIQQAATNAVNDSTAIAQTRNGVGYIVGTGGDSRLIGIKPRATNYDSSQPYGDNL